MSSMTSDRVSQIEVEVGMLNQWHCSDWIKEIVHDLWGEFQLLRIRCVGIKIMWEKSAEENFRLREALRYYADLFPATTGDRAREALAEK